MLRHVCRGNARFESLPGAGARVSLEAPLPRVSRLWADAFLGAPAPFVPLNQIYYILGEIQMLNTKDSGCEAIVQVVFHAHFWGPKTADKTGFCEGVTEGLTVVPPAIHRFIHRSAN